jgi:hypothetical protein
MLGLLADFNVALRDFSDTARDAAVADGRESPARMET